ncbi:MAG: hypothetical protein ACK4WM_00140 [Thermoflexales bacterium]
MQGLRGDLDARKEVERYGTGLLKAGWSYLRLQDRFTSPTKPIQLPLTSTLHVRHAITALR